MTDFFVIRPRTDTLGGKFARNRPKYFLLMFQHQFLTKIVTKRAYTLSQAIFHFVSPVHTHSDIGPQLVFLMHCTSWFVFVIYDFPFVLFCFFQFSFSFMVNKLAEER